ncbi:MAG: tRNA (N6-isopentenyl adenosine(37)-C2)-methylthiotransferase MiaB [Candidatus Dadabacteria bacterium]|nr:MAG: tRNA (N6-isopentenyl adenosine(37)-C2)-methylthiotransferase MiaB [Candidatus Dadabacteria bacterium]
MAKPAVTDKKGQKPAGRLYIKTYGCQMNEYDSEKLAAILEGSHRLVDTPEEADLILINTCSVREKPQHKLFSLLGELKPLKNKNRDLLIGVGGCVAQQEGENIVKRSPVVDFVFGTHNLSLVPSLVEARKNGSPPQVAIDYRDEWEELPLGFSGAERVSVFVSISRGCNKNCSYCIVPVTRGKEVSRDINEIVREVKLAAYRGAREVVLLGQTVNSYGLDLKPRMRFAELLNKVSEVDGIERIRFTSPHPQEVRDDFIDLVADNPKICRHIHMPLQSGSDRILKAMNRNYRRRRYLAIIDALKERVPDIAITTDIIVGFPGETRQDFEETLDIMRRVQFDNSYSFVFSPRPGTPAASMDDPDPYELKLERLKELQELQREITAGRLSAWLGKEVEVLIDGVSTSDKNKLQGRTSQNILVNLNQQTPELEPGCFIKARVTECSRYTLRADFVELIEAVQSKRPPAANLQF